MTVILLLVLVTMLLRTCIRMRQQIRMQMTDCVKRSEVLKLREQQLYGVHIFYPSRYNFLKRIYFCASKRKVSFLNFIDYELEGNNYIMYIFSIWVYIISYKEFIFAFSSESLIIRNKKT